MRGEPLELLEGPQTAGEGWCVVRDLSGARGLVPLSFVGVADMIEEAIVKSRDSVEVSALLLPIFKPTGALGCALQPAVR